MSEVATVGRQRDRLTKRLEQHKKQHGWGGLSDEDYVAKRDEVKAQLATLPDGDPIASFDAFRAQVLALPDAIAVASPARREELCQLVVRPRPRARSCDRTDRVDSRSPADLREKRAGMPQGAWGPARCLMTTRSPSTWHEPQLALGRCERLGRVAATASSSDTTSDRGARGVRRRRRVGSQGGCGAPHPAEYRQTTPRRSACQDRSGSSPGPKKLSSHLTNRTIWCGLGPIRPTLEWRFRPTW
jgi:hypothetical protein